jgi:hypothetical protein
VKAGGGISLDGTRWVPCRPGFLVPVRVLSRLFRDSSLTGLTDAHAASRLAFFGELDPLCNRTAFAAHLAPLRKKNWFVYAKPPFARPAAVLAYLARHIHRVAISNSRLVGLDERGVNSSSPPPLALKVMCADPSRSISFHSSISVIRHRPAKRELMSPPRSASAD